MRMLPIVSALLLTAGTAASGWGADLTKIDRTILKEPVYQGKPEYCLLVFGPEAQTRVWLVLDGDVLYVDRNGNGDLTEDGERLEPKKDDWQIPGRPRIFKHYFDVGDIAVAGQKTKVGPLWIVLQGTAKAVLENECTIGVGGQRAKGVRLAGRADAPVLHFAGPLTVVSIEPAQFVRGQEPKDSVNWLRVRVGTPCLGDGPKFLGFHHDDPGRDLEAQADIDFPCKDGLTKRVSVKLTFECCGPFHGPVRVPDEAISGKAKVVVSFPDLQKVRIAPATFEVPIVESRVKK